MKKIDFNMATPSAFNILIGHSVEECEGMLQKPYFIRVRRENGVEYMVTQEWLPERVSVAVENGIITEILGLG